MSTIKVLFRFPQGNLQYAAKNICDENGNWESRIIKISTLSRNIGYNKTFEASGITLEMDDTDRYFRDMMSGGYRYIAGKKVDIYWQDGSLIYTGTVEKWKFTENAFRLEINDLLSGLDTLLTETISKQDYPEAAPGAIGKSIPLVYGHVTTGTVESGAVPCQRVSSGTFLLARHHCLELDENTAYTQDGTPLAAVLDNNADGKAYILCDSDEDYIFVNVKGKIDGSLNLIDDPIAALKDIIYNYTAMAYSQAEMDAAQEIMIERGYKIAAVLDNQETLNEVIVNFCFSFDCDFFVSKGNEITVTLPKWSALSPAKSFIESQIITFTLEEQPDEIVNKIRYMYRYNWAKQNFVRMPFYEQSESIENWGPFYAKNKPLDLRFVSDGETAYDVVQRYVIQRKNPRRTAQITMPLAEFAGLDIGDIIELEHSAGIDTKPRKYQVRRISIDFKEEKAAVEALDITYLSGGVFILGDALTLASTWEQAGENDRAYGYLADAETGYFANNTDYGKILY